MSSDNSSKRIKISLSLFFLIICLDILIQGNKRTHFLVTCLSSDNSSKRQLKYCYYYFSFCLEVSHLIFSFVVERNDQTVSEILTKFSAYIRHLHPDFQPLLTLQTFTILVVSKDCQGKQEENSSSSATLLGPRQWNIAFYSFFIHLREKGNK